jgi:glycosyltransferase involved in cell wall biosynthesis
MPKIVQVTPWYPPGYKFGGPAMTAAILAEGLNQYGFQVITVTSDRNGDGYMQVPRWVREANGNEVIYCPTSPWRFFYSGSLTSTLETCLPGAAASIINCGSWNYFFLRGCRTSRRFRIPYVVYPHGNFDPWALSHKKWRKKVWWRLFDWNNYQQAAAVVALTPTEASQVRSMGVTTRIKVIPNGVSPEDFHPALNRAEIEDLFPPLQGKRWLLFLARLHQKKGLDLLLSAMSRIRNDHPNMVLVIAGADEGGYSQTIHRLVQELNLRENVYQVGMVTGALKNGLLKNSELFALTSYSEGMPMGVLEAMACGLPVLVTPECNIPEIAAYQAGVIVEKEVNAVAVGLKLLLNNNDQRAEMKINARRLIEEKFTRNRILEETSKLIEEIAPKKKNLP